jgi:predicted Zn-dependent protease
VKRARPLVVIGALALSTVLVAMRAGRSPVGLGSLRQLWSDALRDADRPALTVTRLSDEREMQLGAQLANEMLAQFPDDPAGAARVNAVGSRMLPYLHRKRIAYHFHVIQDGAINACAFPGGQIVVTTGMLAFVQSDSELAEVVGHEMAHVDLRHAVERSQYQYRLGDLIGAVHQLLTMPYAADQELDADAEGMRLAIAAGYDPKAGPQLFARMQQQLHEPAPAQADTPAGEVIYSLGDALVAYFRTHPPSEERARRLKQLVPSTTAP